MVEVTFEKYRMIRVFIQVSPLLEGYSGRETPLYYAVSLTEHLGGAKIYLNAKI